jgi:putative transcriptional regulator
MSDAGKRLINSALQARKIARGEEPPAKAFIPPDIDVKGIRSKLRLTQDDFASEFGFTTSQIRDWEQNRYRPLGSDRAYLMIIEKHPTTVRKMLKDAVREMEQEAEVPSIAQAI